MWPIASNVHRWFERFKKIPILTSEQISYYIWAPFANFNEFLILIREILLYPKGEFANLDFFFQVENQITYLKVENELQDL